jgi:RNA polymerase sigma-B factor
MAYQTSSHTQTMELLIAYRQNPSVHLRNRVVNLNVGLVRKTTHRISHQCAVPFEDLEQVGYMGLITAVERFDPTQGYAFSSFAIPYIRGEILHFLRDRASTVRIPRRWQQLRNEGERACQRLTATLGRQPNDLEMAAELKIEVSEWRSVKLSSTNRTPISLDAHIQSGGHQQSDTATTLGETLLDAHSQIEQGNIEDRLALQHALSQLEDKTREIIESVFLHQESRQQVAQRIGLSPVTVTRRIKKGIEELTGLLQQPSASFSMEG